ncbi:g-protein coupled receptor Mth2 [Nephila pilipes]|uniref:G-protein coupled receptor Mth2 n=1 Tax=Nephila pilipes TaxID=299642 RepID=A0A8X6MBG0_NEPPI|nr:g-protein coupled receptor Mth2 [Nephila pilipes]
MLNVVLLEALVVFACTNASTEVFTTPDPSNDSDFSLIESDNGIYADKHESLKTCFSFDLSPDEYVMFPNKTAFVPNYNRMYEEHLYILISDHLRICPPSEIFEDDLALSSTVSLSLRYLTKVGLGVSMVFLLIHIVVFALVPDLKNLPGWNLASLCFSLFLSYFAMMSSDNDYVREAAGFCIASAVLTQFFFLASFLWMCIISFDIFRSMRKAVDNLRITNKVFNIKKYVISSVISWGIALVFTVAAIITDNVEGIDESMKPQFAMHCWFKTKNSLLVFFAAPVFVLIVLNFILFGITACKIFSNRTSSRMAHINQNHSSINKNYLMYLKLAIIMGATWITGALAPAFDILWMWYLFAALNTLQGFFIFIAFTCTEKVLKYLKLTLLKERRESAVTLSTPTFQSYCNYSNSIEKDLDKIVDNEDKTAQIDTIVIHI